MRQNHWNDRGRAGQPIPRLIWNLKFHYRIHNSPQLDPNLGANKSSQRPSTFIKPPTVRPSKQVLPFVRFIEWRADLLCSVHSHFHHACYKTYPLRPPFITLNNFLWWVQIPNLCILQIYLNPKGPHFLNSLNHRPVYWSSRVFINVDISNMSSRERWHLQHHMWELYEVAVVNNMSRVNLRFTTSNSTILAVLYTDPSTVYLMAGWTTTWRLRQIRWW
jgi:hypothetical protein